MMDTRRILAIKLRNLGDVLLSVPALRAIRESHQGASLSVLVAKGTEEMVEGLPWIDEVLSVDRPKGKHGFWWNMGRELRFLGDLRKLRFDMVVDFTSGDRSAIYGFLSGARERIGREPSGKSGGFRGKSRLYTHLAPPPDHSIHVVENDLDLVRRFGMETRDERLEFAVPPEAEERMGRLLAARGIGAGEPFLHVHPTSRWLFKCWKDESMAETLDRVPGELGLRVVMTSGPEAREVQKARSILSMMNTRPTTLLGEISLKEMGAISRRAQVFLGVDSVPMHIAAAVGTPVVALFGPSGEHNWRPWRAEHQVVALPFDCRPCGRDGCDGSKVSRCLEELPPGDVLAALQSVLKSIRIAEPV